MTVGELCRAADCDLSGVETLWGLFAEAITVATSIAVIIGIPVLIWQIREDRLARYLDGTVSIFAIFDRPGFRELRRFVYNDLSQDPEQVKRNPDHFVKAEMVMVLFNELAMMWKLRIIHGELVLRMYSDAVIRAWMRLKPLIYKAREDRSDPDYGGPFEELYEEAMKYRKKKRYPDLKYFQRPEVSVSQLGEKPSEEPPMKPSSDGQPQCSEQGQPRVAEQHGDSASHTEKERLRATLVLGLMAAIIALKIFQSSASMFGWVSTVFGVLLLYWGVYAGATVYGIFGDFSDTWSRRLKQFGYLSFKFPLYVGAAMIGPVLWELSGILYVPGWSLMVVGILTIIFFVVSETRELLRQSKRMDYARRRVDWCIEFVILVSFLFLADYLARV